MIGKFKQRLIHKVQVLSEKNQVETDFDISKLGRFQLMELISNLKQKMTQKQFDKMIIKLPEKMSPSWVGGMHHTKKEHQVFSCAWEIVGGLSTPTKMPCFSYNLPAYACITGSELAKIEGTTCNKCYANKGWYNMPWVRDKMTYRLFSINHPMWTESMIYLIQYLNQPFFRWHDSGDLQSIEHLDRICQVAWGTYFPEDKLVNTKYWLPTSEWGMVEKYVADMRMLIPPNLKIVLSGKKIDDRPPVELAKRLGVYVSMVSSKTRTCPAPDQLNKCQGCRKCWDDDVFSVVYGLH